MNFFLFNNPALVSNPAVFPVDQWHGQHCIIEDDKIVICSALDWQYLPLSRSTILRWVECWMNTALALFLITNYAPQVLESSIVHLGLLTAPNDWACNVLLDWWRRRSNLCYCRTVTLTSLSRVQQTANQKLPIHCDRDIAELRIFVLRFILILKLWLVTLTASDSASADHCARL